MTDDDYLAADKALMQEARIHAEIGAGMEAAYIHLAAVFLFQHQDYRRELIGGRKVEAAE